MLCVMDLLVFFNEDRSIYKLEVRVISVIIDNIGVCLVCGVC